MNRDEIKVSVCVATYNHEKYIAECLQSLVDQKTNFRFEVIVGEDCSTDSTREIVREFAEKYPDIIVPIYHEENVGVIKITSPRMMRQRESILRIWMGTIMLCRENYRLRLIFWMITHHVILSGTG